MNCFLCIFINPAICSHALRNGLLTYLPKYCFLKKLHNSRMYEHNSILGLLDFELASVVPLITEYTHSELLSGTGKKPKNSIKNGQILLNNVNLTTFVLNVYTYNYLSLAHFYLSQVSLTKIQN